MCGRYSQYYTWQELHDLMRLLDGVPAFPEGDVKTRLDIRPTQTIDVLRNGDDGYEWARMRWGFDVPWSKSLLINAKAESMTGRWWSQAMPAVVFASGFYEWPLKKGGKKPANYARYNFTITDQPVMMLAGLWRPWTTKDNEAADCVAIATTEPNSLFQKLPHHRMAAVLPPEKFEAWMSSKPSDRKAILEPYPAQYMTGQQVEEPNGDMLVSVRDPL